MDNCIHRCSWKVSCFRDLIYSILFLALFLCNDIWRLIARSSTWPGLFIKSCSKDSLFVYRASMWALAVTALLLPWKTQESHYIQVCHNLFNERTDIRKSHHLSYIPNWWYMPEQNLERAIRLGNQINYLSKHMPLMQPSKKSERLATRFTNHKC